MRRDEGPLVGEISVMDAGEWIRIESGWLRDGSGAPRIRDAIVLMRGVRIVEAGPSRERPSIGRLDDRFAVSDRHPAARSHRPPCSRRVQQPRRYGPAGMAGDPRVRCGLRWRECRSQSRAWLHRGPRCRLPPPDRSGGRRHPTAEYPSRPAAIAAALCIHMACTLRGSSSSSGNAASPANTLCARRHRPQPSRLSSTMAQGTSGPAASPMS